MIRGMETSAKMNVLSKILLFVLTCMCSLSVAGQGPVKRTTLDAQSAQVIDNWIHKGGESKIRARYIFIYLPERDFDLPAIRALVDKYQEQFCDPYILEIDIYSDKAMLEKKIRWEKSGAWRDFTDNEAGRRAAQAYYSQVLPATTGYLRAEYARYGDYEVIDYSKSKEDLADTLTIRSPNQPRERPTTCKR